MTKETYDRVNYIGRHTRKTYKVWRVLGPAGPEETFNVCGLQEAAEAVYGMWDAEVTDMDGNHIPTHILIYNMKQKG